MEKDGIQKQSPQMEALPKLIIYLITSYYSILFQKHLPMHKQSLPVESFFIATQKDSIPKLNTLALRLNVLESTTFSL